MRQHHMDEEVLTAYLKGELDATQTARIEAWYDASAANQKMLGEVYYLLYINDCLNDAAQIDVEQSLQRLKSRMHTHRPATHSFRNIAWRIAAAAVVVVAVVTGFRGISALSEKLSKPVQIYTQLGERSQIILPDGTKVWLNSCSYIEYTSPLFSRERRIRVNGEAYFEVAHNKQSPFIVSANGLDVKVLGTKFNIRSDEQRHRVTTVLLEGSVLAYAAANQSNNILLHPMQSVVFDTQTQQMVLSNNTEAHNSINWIEGRLHFDQRPFSEIAAELKRYFNVDIIFKNEALQKECFSGDFQVADGIYHIMSVLGLTYKFHYQIADDDILLYTN